MNIKFYPKSDEENLSKAILDYQNIWDKEGERIIEIIEKVSEIVFKTEESKAMVYEGKSTSHPLHLRASYSDDVKKGTLIHELIHILFVDNDIEQGSSLEIHKKLNPILYKVWTELYGKDFADKMVEVEIKRGDVYKEAWAD